MNGTNSTAVTVYYLGTNIADLVYFSIHAGVVAVHLTLWFFLHKKQPLRSRLYAPLLFLFFLLIYFATRFIAMLVETVERVQTNNINYKDPIYSTLKALIYAMAMFMNSFIVCSFMMQAGRYLAWQNLSVIQQDTLSQQLNSSFDASSSDHSPSVPSTHLVPNRGSYSEKAAMRGRIYKCCTSLPVSIGFMSAMTALLLIVVCIVTSVMIAKNIDRDEMLIAPEALVQAFFGTIAFIGVVLFNIMDACINRSDCCRPAYFEKDSLLFRRDIILFYTLYIGFIATNIFYVLARLPDENGPWGVILYICGNICLSYSWLAAQYSAGGVSCMYVIIWRRISRRSEVKVGQKEHQNEDFVAVMEDVEGRELFKVFVEAEYSTENFYCWVLIQDVVGEKEQITKEKMFQKLCNTFILEHALCEVNLPNTIREQVKSAMKNPALQNEAIKALEPAVCFNLYDSLSRFRRTKAFRLWKLKMSQMNTELNRLGKAII